MVGLLQRKKTCLGFIGAVLVATTMLTVIAPNVVKAVDTLSWYSSDRDLNNGETVTGYQRVIVTSSTRYTNRYIAKWCIYLDGQPITGISYQSDFKTPEPSSGSGSGPPAWIYYGRGVVSRIATNQTTEGCWNTISGDQSFGFDIALNTTTWSNASHNFVIEATTDDNTTHAKSVTVTSANVEPTVQWTTTAPVRAADTTWVDARITPSANRIVKACLTRDSTAIVADELTTFTGDTQYGNSPRGPSGKFGSAAGGCVLFDESQFWPPGLSIVTNLSIGVQTKTWSQIPTKITLTIFESIGRSYSTDLSFDSSLPLPLLTINESSGSTWRLNTSLKTAFSSSGVDVTRICATLDGLSNSALEINDCIVGNDAKIFSYKKTFAVQTLQLTNGMHRLRILVTDRFGRSGTSDFEFLVDNKNPLLAPAGVSSGDKIKGRIAITPNGSISPLMSSAELADVCVTGPSTASTCGNTQHNVNTACYAQGEHSISITATDSYGLFTTNKYQLTITNPLPAVAALRAKTNSPRWSDKSISGEITFRQSYGCNYKIQISAPNHKTVTYLGTLSDNSITKRFSNLKPSTRYNAKISIIAKRGLRTRAISFTTPAIPPRPQINNTNNSSGQYIPNVKGKRLDIAIAFLEAKGIPYNYDYARDCSAYGLSAGAWGIQQYSNWVVVEQYGTSLYACKFR